MPDPRLMTIRRAGWGLFVASLLGGCGGPGSGGVPALDGTLGFAQFTLECDYEACVDPTVVPAFARGASFDFAVRIDDNVPDADREAYVVMHSGDAQFIDGVELRTVIAYSSRSSRLVDYAYVYLYDPTEFRIDEEDGSPLQRDEGVYIVATGSQPARVAGLRSGRELVGTIQYRPLDPDVLYVATRGEQVDFVGRRSGDARIEVTLGGYSEVLEFRVTSGTRTNPPPPTPTGPRTNPTPDPTDTDTDGSTGGDGSTGADTDAGSSTGTGGMQ